MERVLSVSVNGEAMLTSDGVSVRQFLEKLGLDPLRVAVERNRAILPRSSFDGVQVREGDRFEIVQFVGGG